MSHDSSRARVTRCRLGNGQFPALEPIDALLEKESPPTGSQRQMRHGESLGRNPTAETASMPLLCVGFAVDFLRTNTLPFHNPAHFAAPSLVTPEREYAHRYVQTQPALGVVPGLRDGSKAILNLIAPNRGKSYQIVLKGVPPIQAINLLPKLDLPLRSLATSQTGQTKSNQKSRPIQPNPTKLARRSLGVGGSDQIRPNPTKSNQIQPNPTKSNQIQPNPTKSHP
jgi:hypothetical protein